MQPIAALSPFTVDLFCRVIDNYGDAGVCLRLARALVRRHSFIVRLWCDDVPLLNRLEPDPAAGLSYHGWQAHTHALPAQGVICGFGCTLDDAYLLAMAACKPQPAYIHLEYLSAEPWVETTHGLWSTHPRFGLKQWFCNPGFNANTAGLLHEDHAMTEVQALQALSQYGAVPLNTQRVFVFGYPCAAFDTFIAAARSVSQPTHWVLPQGAAGLALYDALQGRTGHTFTRLPFVSQAQFDAALRSCHAAWVRGEDSAITALFAGIPMLWQFYPQDDGAHWIKMQAYVDVVGSVGTIATSLMSRDLKVWVLAMQACNGHAAMTLCETEKALKQFLSAPPPQQSIARRWAQHCSENVPDLAATVSCWLREWKIT